jgi:hypothetical protein
MSDLAPDWSKINDKVTSLKTYKEVSQATKDLTKSAGDSLSESVGKASAQLNKIKEQQKRFQRNVPTSMDQLISLIGKTKGEGSATLRYLRKKLIEAAIKLEPKVKEIIIGETIKVLGCSQEQTYPGISLNLNLPLIPQIPLLPVSQGIYIPVNSIDFAGNLKMNPYSLIGKLFYEKQEPSVGVQFKPYGGPVNYPFNKMLNLKMNNPDRTYSTEFGNFYNGSSEQKLFDISYTNTNDLGVSGDYFRVFLLDRNGGSNSSNSTFKNRVGEFLNDYYSTVKFVDPVNICGAVLNSISNAVSIKAGLSYRELTNEGKFDRVLTRILGLCQDSRREIDVSGVAKIPELDGVDDSFFEFTEIDLREINSKINNIQNGIIQLESCGDVKLPVNADTIVEEIAKFRDNLSGNSIQQNVQTIENIIDTFIDNPDWKPLVPAGVKVDIEINKNVLKNLPKAVVSGILTPKVLLPIFVLIQVIEQSAKNTVNSLIQSVNTTIQSNNTNIQSINASLQSGTTIGQDVNNIINDGADFLKKFKSFSIEVISKISAEFLKILFDILKKDILNLLNVAIIDINKSAAAKKYTIILRLVQLALIIIQLVKDYRKCKSLVNDLLNLLNLINSTFNKGNRIPTPLLFLTQALPGFSPERAQINAIEFLQKMGAPTGPMPDGSPNIMNQFMGALTKGMDKEESENGTIDATVIVPPLTGGLLTVYGKKR